MAVSRVPCVTGAQPSGSWEGCWAPHMVWIRGAHLGGGDGDLTSSPINANSSSAAAAIDQQPTETRVHKTTYLGSASKGLSWTKSPLE